MVTPDHERRNVVDYLRMEAEGEVVVSAEKVKTERILDRKHDIWDVQTDQHRWWVVTNPTNLYSREHFDSIDQLLSFHIGLMHRIMANSVKSAKGQTSDEELHRLGVPWRKWEQAAEALENGDEAEDFQAVGMRCREALLALTEFTATSDMIPDGVDAPKKGDFVARSELVAKALTAGSNRIATLLTRSAAETWRLASWLTHERNAVRFDAVIAVESTQSVLGLFGAALVRHERGEPDRCPNCASYRLCGDYRIDTNDSVTLCEACDWESEPTRWPN